MRVRFNHPWFAAVCVGLWIMGSGCQLLNNKWIRVRRGGNPDVARSKISIPGLLGPRERVQRFFSSYQLRDWKGMESTVESRSDLLFLKDQFLEDFQKYIEIVAKVTLDKAIFNKAEDRAQVRVEFRIEKIDANSGALTVVQGTGSFVMTSRGQWDILGYVGDPFWGEGKK